MPGLLIRIVPPCLKNTNFATGQNHGPPNLTLTWPDIFTLDASIPSPQQCNRRFGGAPKVCTTRQQLTGIIYNIHTQVRGSRVN
jgi:hypothetical protein